MTQITRRSAPMLRERSWAPWFAARIDDRRAALYRAERELAYRRIMNAARESCTSDVPPVQRAAAAQACPPFVPPASHYERQFSVLKMTILFAALVVASMLALVGIPV